MTGYNDFLFSKGHLSDFLRKQFDKVGEEVRIIPKNQLLSAPKEEIVDHIISKLSIEPLELHEESMVMETSETTINVTGRHDRYNFGQSEPVLVPGTRVIITIPFTGDPRLWQLRPSHWRSSFPMATVRYPDSRGTGYVDLIVEEPSDIGPEKFKRIVDETLDDIKFYIENQKKEIEQQNATFLQLIERAVDERLDILEKQEGIVKSLNIPIKKREGIPDIQPINVKRKLVRPLPFSPKEGFKPEPGITMDVYEHILGVIRHEGRTFETTPKTYAVHDEEELRDILLAHLNGHYQGGATGETFRKKGRTDIRIEEENRAAFVAECKIWRGQELLLKACDQLLSYLTWRDCKAAIIIFNKDNPKFTELLLKIPTIFPQHPLFIKDLSLQREGEWRFLFSSAEDDARRIYIHVFLFNVYFKT
jgi:hypothetical protein